MLGHGGKSRWSGRLYSHHHAPLVLDPKVLGLEATTEMLEHSISCPPLEFASSNGEALMLSLSKEPQGQALPGDQVPGVFSDGAAISVVFVSDENDVCFDPRAYGYTKSPDFKPSWFNLEKRALRKYCGGLTPESLLAELRSAFPGRKITMGAIVHTDPASVTSCGEDTIGHGFIELVSQTPDGILMDIKSGDIDAGLMRLATASSVQLSLQTTFELGKQREAGSGLGTGLRGWQAGSRELRSPRRRPSDPGI
jgi:hypothetical protein